VEHLFSKIRNLSDRNHDILTATLSTHLPDHDVLTPPIPFGRHSRDVGGSSGPWNVKNPDVFNETFRRCKKHARIKGQLNTKKDI